MYAPLLCVYFDDGQVSRAAEDVVRVVARVQAQGAAIVRCQSHSQKVRFGIASTKRPAPQPVRQSTTQARSSHASLSRRQLLRGNAPDGRPRKVPIPPAMGGGRTDPHASDANHARSLRQSRVRDDDRFRAPRDGRALPRARLPVPRETDRERSPLAGRRIGGSGTGARPQCIRSAL